MSRPLRIEFPGAVYHVTSRGNAKQPIYLDDEDRELFLGLLSHVIDRFAWKCHAYCLMDNHYHLLIETPRPNLSRGMRQLNGTYTQAHNRRHDKDGHLLQGRFKSILVEKEAYLLELCRYVVLNPVRAGMLEAPAKWPWSSYRATAGETTAPAFLSVDWLLRQFGKKYASARTKYKDFVKEGFEASSPWDELQGQIYLGGEDFIEKHQPNQVIEEVPRVQTLAHRPTLKALFEEQDDQNSFIVKAYRQYGYRLLEIAKHLNLHYSTISRQLKQAEKRNA